MKFGVKELPKSKRMRFLFFLLLPFLVLGQTPDDKKELYFVALYTTGDAWDNSKAPNEQAYFKAHSNFLQQLRSEKIIALGARYDETGMVVFKASDLTAAKTLIHSDSAVQNKLFDVEIHEFSSFYNGCIQ